MLSIFPRSARDELGASGCLTLLTLMCDLVINLGSDIGLPLQQPGAQSMTLIGIDWQKLASKFAADSGIGSFFVSLRRPLNPSPRFPNIELDCQQAPPFYVPFYYREIWATAAQRPDPLALH